MEKRVFESGDMAVALRGFGKTGEIRLLVRREEGSSVVLGPEDLVPAIEVLQAASEHLAKRRIGKLIKAIEASAR